MSEKSLKKRKKWASVNSCDCLQGFMRATVNALRTHGWDQEKGDYQIILLRGSMDLVS